MRAEIVNTGTELLLGEVVNLHVVALAQALWPIGLRLQRQTTVPDGAAIREALIEAFPRCEVLIVTGGLGPTSDDVTREITAELLGLRLVEDAEVLAGIKARCARRGLPFVERMGRQAMVPEGATILPNGFGTAPGLYLAPTATLATATPHLFLLPGPPHELNPIVEHSVVPILRAAGAARAGVASRTYRCVGIGESAVEERVSHLLAAEPAIEIGYCARPNEVDLRLIGPPDRLAGVDRLVRAALGDHIFATDGESLEAAIVRRLRDLGATLATAESCTGGALANRITNVPGASDVFRLGWVTYSNDAKIAELGVNPASLEADGAVSEVVAAEMAAGARAAAGADFALATTGIAGPSGGTPTKPVGTVFIALAARAGILSVRREQFETGRLTFKQFASQAALDMLRRAIPMVAAN